MISWDWHIKLILKGSCLLLVTVKWAERPGWLCQAWGVEAESGCNCSRSLGAAFALRGLNFSPIFKRRPFLVLPLAGRCHSRGPGISFSELRDHIYQPGDVLRCIRSASLEGTWLPLLCLGVAWGWPAVWLSPKDQQSQQAYFHVLLPHECACNGLMFRRFI